jgi:hypothetical protein
MADAPRLERYVRSAGEWMPFKMYNYDISQSCNSHVARVQIYVSTACLGGWFSTAGGVRAPTLVLKSPHINVVTYGCSCSIMSSTWDVACSSIILRLDKDDVGGR